MLIFVFMCIVFYFLGFGLVFVVYLEVIVRMFYLLIWVFFFFFMLIFLGLFSMVIK